MILQDKNAEKRNQLTINAKFAEIVVVGFGLEQYLNWHVITA